MPTGRFASTTCRFVRERRHGAEASRHRVASRPCCRSTSPTSPRSGSPTALGARRHAAPSVLDQSSGTTGPRPGRADRRPGRAADRVREAGAVRRAPARVRHVGRHGRRRGPLLPRPRARDPGAHPERLVRRHRRRRLRDGARGSRRERLPVPAPEGRRHRVAGARHRRAAGRAARALLGVAALRRATATSRGSRRRAPGGAAAARRSCRWPSTTSAISCPRSSIVSPTSTSRATTTSCALWNSGPAHVRARRSAHGQPLRRHRRRRPHRLPRLGGDRPFARPARRRVRAVQLDPGRGARRRRAGARSSATASCSPRPASTSTPTPRGSSTGCSRSTRGCRRRRPRAWARSGSRCTSGSAGRKRATAACDQLGCVDLLEQLLG